MRDRSSFVKPLSSTEVEAENVDVLFLVWLLSRSADDLIDTLLAPAGLTGDEFALYSILDAAGAITPTELARWMAAPPTTVSSYVKRLEGRGHVERRPNPDDRRSYLVRLTTDGTRSHQHARRLFAPLRERLDASLGAEQENVHRVLLDLRGVLDDLRAEDAS